MHIKTLILLGNFFHLVCVMLLHVICQQRFLFNVFTFFIVFIKNAFFNVFYSQGQRFLHLWFLVSSFICLFLAFDDSAVLLDGGRLPVVSFLFSRLQGDQSSTIDRASPSNWLPPADRPLPRFFGWCSMLDSIPSRLGLCGSWSLAPARGNKAEPAEAYSPRQGK